MSEVPPSEVPGIYPARWESDAVLADGSTVHLRPIRSSDRSALTALHDSLSAETVYYRFFSALPHLSPALLERFTTVDYVDRFALVAEKGDRFVAVARYDRIPGRDDAEVAFVVADDYQGKGLGTLLLEHLAVAAKHAGVRRFVADTLPENQRMLRVFTEAGFGARRSFEGGVVRVSFPLEPTEESVAAMQDRERRASARSVARVLAPDTVAVVGASRRAGTVGGAVFRHLLEGGFAGTVYPVHREAHAVAGVKAYRTVSEIPDPVDLAVIVTPAAEVMSVVEDCAVAGVGGLVILSAGFAESGPQGAALERRLVLAARRQGMRVVGPNCMGVANTDPAIGLNASLAPVLPHPGPVGLMAQAGALGIAILEAARGRGMGLSTFVSAGNKADMSGNDLLHYWEQDESTKVILWYLESFGNPRTFARIARRVTRSKPIVVVKGGRTPAGSRAVTHHTGATSSPETAVAGLFLQTGVIRVDSLDQLLDVGHALALQPLPTGRRVGIIGNGGGPGVLAADACEGAGLEVPELGAGTRATLEDIGPVTSSWNPVNLAHDATPADYERALRAVLADEATDAVLAVWVPPVVAGSGELRDRSAEVAAVISRVTTEAVPTKPVLANFLALQGVPDALRTKDGGGVPSYGFPEAAALALARMADLAEWRRRPEGTIVALEGVDRAAATAITARALRLEPDGCDLSSADGQALVAAYGVPAGQGPSLLSVRLDHDPTFGPLLSAGAPGAPPGEPRVLPLTDIDAREVIAAARPGAGPGEREVLEDFLLRVARLADDVAEVAQAVIVVAQDGAVEVAVRVEPSDPHPEFALRRLR